MHPRESQHGLHRVICILFCCAQRVPVGHPDSPINPPEMKTVEKKKILQSVSVLTKASYWITGLGIKLLQPNLKTLKMPFLHSFPTHPFLYSPNEIAQGYNFNLMTSQIINRCS